MKKNLGVYLKLFTTTLYVSAFTFGGGYVIVPLLRKRFVEDLGWIDEDEMLNLTAIAQSSPGAIAINASVAIGYKVARIPGIFIAVFAAILPPFVIISVITLFYQMFRDNLYVSAALRGMNAGVAAVISDVCINLSFPYFRERQLLSIAIMFVAFVLIFFLDVNAVVIILIFAFLGAAGFVFKKRRGSKS